MKKILIYLVNLILLLNIFFGINTVYANSDGGYTIADSQSMAVGGNKFVIKVQTVDKPLSVMVTAAQQAEENLKDNKFIVLWTSSDDSIVKVTKDKNHKTWGNLEAKKAGEATVKCVIKKTDTPLTDPLGTTGTLIATLKTKVTVAKKVTSSTTFSAEGSEDSGDKKTLLGSKSLTGAKGSNRKTSSFEDVLSDTSKFKPSDISSSSANKIEQKAGVILAYVSNVGIVASIIIIAVIGIKYMIGSVEEKAEYKESLVPYFIGAVMLFGVGLIVKIIRALGSQIANI